MNRYYFLDKNNHLYLISYAHINSKWLKLWPNTIYIGNDTLLIHNICTITTRWSILILKQRLNRLITAKRSFLLGTGGFLAMTGSRWYGYPVAGPLACIISAFVASTGWRWRLKMQDDRNNPTISVDENCDDEDDQELQGKPVEKVFEYVWDGLQPSVFAFLGTDIKFELLKGFDMVLVGLLVVTFGIAVCI